ncbi:Poly(ADP-ribose) glycohydrolase 1-like [Oopsacas minuta]|uniref:poly(ADP-ribose) glycohydrolase n=1 Tax=Oopsacas minuta TaxID=111878 RepID=A0AAV7K267_9METZ|nr:Poly(ADP-ribose) glycohydrolase 1-like [Oopsacas minuta]
MAAKVTTLSYGIHTIVLPHQTPHWEEISKLLTEIKSKPTMDMTEFVKLYRSIYSIPEAQLLQPPLKNLKQASMAKSEPGSLITQLLPYIADLALRVDFLFPEPIPLLAQGMQHTACVSRLQIACLLANALFNTIPTQGQNMQTLTLVDLLNLSFFTSQISKLTCIMEYFRRIREHELKDDLDYLKRNISVERRLLFSAKTPCFSESTVPLSAFKSFSTGLIEDAHGCLQADFANQYIGGGVLTTGNVQEEIRFVVSPECLFSLLVCEVMLPNEAIIITGAEKFSNYSGYGGNFRFEGPCIDNNPVDQNNRSLTSIVCIDALEGCGGIKDQCSIIPFKRELIKSFCGFSCDEVLSKDGENFHRLPVASGNWGCGMFGGNKEVKTIIQWISASLSGRDLYYFTFNDKNLTAKQEEFVKICIDNKLTVGDLYNYCIEFGGKDTEEVSIFEYIYYKFPKKEQMICD